MKEKVSMLKKLMNSEMPLKLINLSQLVSKVLKKVLADFQEDRDVDQLKKCGK
jgi:hypothetical protein